MSALPSPYDDAEKGVFDPHDDSVSPIAGDSPSTVVSDSLPAFPAPVALSPLKKEGSVATLAVPELLSEQALKKPLEVVAKKPLEVAAKKPLEVAAKKPTPAPKKKASRAIRFRLWFNTYRKFFTIVVTFNLIGIIMAAAGRFDYATNHFGALVLGNLLVAVLMRNELFMRFLYALTIFLLKGWSPIWMRLAATSALQHVGGIHSGCATSGTAWLVYKIVDLFIHHSQQHASVLAMGVVTNLAVAGSIASAFPWIRNTHHNVFERHHRFVGWLGLAATWVFVILGNCYDVDTGNFYPSGEYLISAQEFWFALGMTIFVLIPWVTVREVPVEVEIPSPKAAIIRFDRGMQQGLLGRVSRTSILEYHAFGLVSEGVNAKYHYMICGVQGDFTKGLVTDPPKTLWTRELKFAGVSHCSAMFTRGIRIATGTGIGAALSTCIQSKNWFLIWIGSDQEKTFGPTIAGLIHKHIEPERLILWDSKARGGRPDTMKLLKEVYVSWKAEVVFITSNWNGNQEIMQGCAEAGINAFGTLWDF